MQTSTFDAPSMFGDHHVTEVRRVLLEITGVSEVYASSSFRVIQVSYDPDKVSLVDLESKLKATGYLEDLPDTVESNTPAQSANGKKIPFRHSTTYETTRNTVSFARRVNYEGRPLWPCPGMGTVEMVIEEAEE